MEDQNTRQSLLTAGKKEFLAHGYKGASLRRICADAGVTTGALYFFFDNKADLFAEIVRRPLEEFSHLAEESIAIEFRDGSAFPETEDRIIRFLIANRDECILLLEKADGTIYADFREKWQEKLEQVFSTFFEKYLGKKADPAIVHLITTMRMHGYLELLRAGYSEGESRKLVNEMAVYADAGFYALIDALKQEK